MTPKFQLRLWWPFAWHEANEADFHSKRRRNQERDLISPDFARNYFSCGPDWTIFTLRGRETSNWDTFKNPLHLWAIQVTPLNTRTKNTFKEISFNCKTQKFCKPFDLKYFFKVITRQCRYKNIIVFWRHFLSIVSKQSIKFDNYKFKKFLSPEIENENFSKGKILHCSLYFTLYHFLFTHLY